MTERIALTRSDSAKTAVLVHVAFLFTGVVTTMLGPLLPELSARWSLNDAEAGALFALQSSGSLLGIGAITLLTQRLGFARLLAAGAALMAAGAAGLALEAFLAGTASILVFGAGLGIMIPGTNVLSAELNPGRGAVALNLVNSAWCAGAFLGPILIALALERASLRVFLLSLSAVLALSCAAYWRASRRELAAVGLRREAPSPATASQGFSAAFLIGLLLFLYVGVETATWGWIVTYARRLGASETGWALLQSTFWLAILVGRLLSSVILRRLRAQTAVLAALVLVLAGTAELAAVSSLPALLAGAALAGLGMACIYPTSVAIFAEAYGSQSSRASGLVFSLAILGGAAVPWIVGVASEFSGSLRIAMLAPVAGSAAMIGVQLAIMRALPGPSRGLPR